MEDELRSKNDEVSNFKAWDEDVKRRALEAEGRVLKLEEQSQRVESEQQQWKQKAIELEQEHKYGICYPFTAQLHLHH